MVRLVLCSWEILAGITAGILALACNINVYAALTPVNCQVLTTTKFQAIYQVLIFNIHTFVGKYFSCYGNVFTCTYKSFNIVYVYPCVCTMSIVLIYTHHVLYMYYRRFYKASREIKTRRKLTTSERSEP